MPVTLVAETVTDARGTRFRLTITGEPAEVAATYRAVQPGAKPAAAPTTEINYLSPDLLATRPAPARD